jgi:hypothetical protein
MDLRDLGWDGVDWTHVAWGRDLRWALVTMVLNLLGQEDVGSMFLQDVGIYLKVHMALQHRRLISISLLS